MTCSVAPHGLRLPRSRGVKEAIVQRALCHALKDSGWSVWRVGQYDARRTQDAGVSDVIAAHRRHGVWFLEVKRESGGVVSDAQRQDRKSTRLNSSHQKISYAVFCLKK